jgi:hypothetical protein
VAGQVRLAPSGRALSDLEVAGVTIWRTLADLPEPDGAGKRVVLPGRYLVVGDPDAPAGPGIITVPAEEYLSLEDPDATEQAHAIVGAGGIIERETGSAVPYLLTVAASAWNVLLDGLVAFNGNESLIDLQGDAPEKRRVVRDCTLATAVNGIRIGAGCKAVVDGCTIYYCAACILDLGPATRIVACHLHSATHCLDLQSSSGACLVAACQLNAATAGVRWSGTGHLSVAGSDISLLGTGILGDGPKGGESSLCVTGSRIFAVADCIDLTTAIPNAGTSLVGNQLNWYTNAYVGFTAGTPKVYSRANMLGSARATESVITP